MEQIPIMTSTFRIWAAVLSPLEALILNRHAPNRHPAVIMNHIITLSFCFTDFYLRQSRNRYDAVVEIGLCRIVPDVIGLVKSLGVVHHRLNAPALHRGSADKVLERSGLNL